ncbi:XRE family transcriptional regulator [Ramlibacter sp. AN1015]|uniref:helix-turn-helix domain-containing protein n=1 Tax=Ramlibacter sp. AN1015 TaxID=3133428 RepID=UPI0030C29BEB
MPAARPVNTTEETPAAPLMLGGRLRRLRRLKGMTLEELARAVDVDKAHLSRIENNLKSPSIATLAQLARALGVSIGHLLGETVDKAEIKVTRAAQREVASAFPDGQHGIVPLLHGDSVASFEAFLVYPGSDPGATEARHAGQEMLFILSGSVEVVFQRHSVTVGQGDCIHFPGYLEHRLRRVGRARAVALLVLSNS